MWIPMGSTLLAVRIPTYPIHITVRNSSNALHILPKTGISTILIPELCQKIMFQNTCLNPSYGKSNRCQNPVVCLQVCPGSTLIDALDMEACCHILRFRLSV